MPKTFADDEKIVGKFLFWAFKNVYQMLTSS